jgi:hypothetical protein
LELASLKSVPAGLFWGITHFKALQFKQILILIFFRCLLSLGVVLNDRASIYFSIILKEEFAEALGNLEERAKHQ